MASKKEIFEIQKSRQPLFPKDRIAFYWSYKAASDDIDAFKEYQAGRMTLGMLCKALAYNNYLEAVTEEQALNEMNIIGWKR